MYLPFILTMLLIMLGIDIYFYKSYAPLLKNVKHKRWVNIVYWSFTAFGIAVLLVAVYHYVVNAPPPKFARTYLFGFVFMVLISKAIGMIFFLVNDLKRLVLYLLKKGRPKNSNSSTIQRISRNQFLRKTGVVAALLPFISLNYGMLFSAFDFRIRKTKLHLPDLPDALNGLRIVQISDIHSGSFMSNAPFEKAVEMINAQQPDLVFFTGDLVNEIAEEAAPFLATFKKIQSSLGVYSVLGNHDYGDYFYPKGDEDGRIHNRKLMKKMNTQMGWDLLLNEHRTIEHKEAKIGIVGCENWGHAARFPKYGDLEKSMEGMEKCDVTLLLSHDPSHWEAEVLTKHPHIDLTFSGHTHGFQMGIEIPGFKWSPAKYLYKQWAGLYQQSGQYIYVNRGLGFLGYPGRLGILPEITVIELTSNSTV
jgi:predicted MPP superfamily phosphohydrolase